MSEKKGWRILNECRSLLEQELLVSPTPSLPLRVTFLLYRSGPPSNLVGMSRLSLDCQFS